MEGRRGTCAKRLQRKEHESWKPSPGAFLVSYLAGRYVSSVVALSRKEKEEGADEEEKEEEEKEEGEKDEEEAEGKYGIQRNRVQVPNGCMYTCANPCASHAHF